MYAYLVKTKELRFESESEHVSSIIDPIARVAIL